MAKKWIVSVPRLGAVMVTGYDIGEATQPRPATHRGWMPLAGDVAGWSMRRADERGEPLNLTLGFDGLTFANSRLSSPDSCGSIAGSQSPSCKRFRTATPSPRTRHLLADA